MKLALVNYGASLGGWKYLYFLAKGLLAVKPGLGLDVFYSELPAEPNLLEALKALPLNLLPTYAFQEKKRVFTGLNGFDKTLNKVWRSFRKKQFLKQYAYFQYIDALNTYDLVHFTWPYGRPCPPLTVPASFIPHDFIYSYYFGTNVVCWEQALSIKQQHADFLGSAQPVVSSQFIAEEFKQVFPEAERTPEVVYLSRFNKGQPLAAQTVTETLNRLGISKPYVLYANNNTAHKNLGQVFGAFYKVKQRYPELKLVITGYGQPVMQGLCTTPYYVDWFGKPGEPYNVKSLGLVSEEVLTPLIQGAGMVINASLCEAGNGSGTEAWALGTPVVMSDIPAFKNQMDFLGVKAELFNPRNDDSIANAIIKLLETPELAAENARLSKAAMERYTWEDVARHYLELFEREIATFHNKPSGPVVQREASVNELVAAL